MSEPTKCSCRPGCRFTAAPGEPFALQHDPRPERQAERKAYFAATGKRGVEQRAAHRQARQRRGCSLRTTDDLLGELERVLLDLDRASGDVAARARAKVDLLRTAHMVLKGAELETQNRELRELLLEHHPELRKHLKSVG